MYLAFLLKKKLNCTSTTRDERMANDTIDSPQTTVGTSTTNRESKEIKSKKPISINNNESVQITIA